MACNSSFDWFLNVFANSETVHRSSARCGTKKKLGVWSPVRVTTCFHSLLAWSQVTICFHSSSHKSSGQWSQNGVMDHWEALQFKLALSPRGKKHDLKDLVGHNCKVSLFQVALLFSSRLGKYFVCGETALAGRDLALVRPTRRNGRQNPFHIEDHDG